MGATTSIRDAGATGGNVLPKDDLPDVTRFKSAAAKRVQACRGAAESALFVPPVRNSCRHRPRINRAAVPACVAVDRLLYLTSVPRRSGQIRNSPSPIEEIRRVRPR
jgi:hypothetical protein